MPTITELAAAVGFTVEDESKFNMDKFREHLSKTYTPTETILRDETLRKKITGKVLGSLSTKAAQEFGLRSSEVDGKPMEEIFGLIKSRHTHTINELTEKAGQTEELQKQLNAKDESIKALQEKHQADAKQWENNLKAYKLNDKLSRAYSSLYLRLTDDYHKNELVKTGFDTYINHTYLFELNDKDEVEVKEKATGNIIKNNAVEEILLSAAEAKGVLKKNNAVQLARRGGLANRTDEQEIKIHPNALKRAKL